jgi:hypothetical protein
MAIIQLDATQIFIYGILWGAFCGVTGWFTNYNVADFRERRARAHALEDARENRKRDFCGFMSAFRSWVERASLGDLGEGFNDRVHPFREQAARIRQDIPDDKRAQFDELVTTLCRLTPSQVTEYEFKGGDNVDYIGKNKLCNAIDRLVEMLT